MSTDLEILGTNGRRKAATTSTIGNDRMRNTVGGWEGQRNRNITSETRMGIRYMRGEGDTVDRGGYGRGRSID